MVVPNDKISLLQLINHVNQVNSSQTPQNNANRRISLVVPQPTGGQPVHNNQSMSNIPQMQQTIISQHTQANTSADGRKRNITDKKKKSQGRITQDISSSVERQAHHKFSVSGYVSAHAFNLSGHQGTSNQSLNRQGSMQHNEHQQLSGKKKSSVTRISNHLRSSQENGIGMSIINQKVTPKTLNTVYTQDQLKQMRNQTLSPPPNKQQKPSTAQQNAALSKSNTKNGNSSLQRSTKKISQLQCLVKKQQQQKSLSRDFTNAIMNTNLNKVSQAQFQLFKSQNNQSSLPQNSSNSNNNTILNGTLTSSQGLYNHLQTLPNPSLSPNSRLVGVNSSQKKKKKNIIKKKKDESNSLAQSIQLFKPPINKNIQNALMQTSLNLKSGFHSILNDSKECSLTRVNLTQHPNISLSMNQSTLQNLTQNQSSISSSTSNRQQQQTQNTQKSQIRKQQRSNTQERILKAAEAQIQQIEQELHFTNKKGAMHTANTNNPSTSQQSLTSSMTSLQPDQQKLRQLVQNTLQSQCEYLNKESNTTKQVSLGGGGAGGSTSITNMNNLQQNAAKKSQQSSQYNSAYIKTEDLFHLDKTFTDIIEQIQSQSVPSDNQIQQIKQQANLTLIKSQLEKIKNSYEQIIKRLSDTQNTQSLSARLKQQRLLSDRQLQNEDDNTTHATNSNNDCFSVSSSFRNQQNIINSQNQMQQKILELEQKNMLLQGQLKSKDETIAHQESIIELLKQEVKKEDVGIQTASVESVCQTPIITDRKADLIVDNEQLKRQNKRLQKKIEYHKNKENKFLFFLFSLQNQGIPVNEIYEKEGIKDIPTSRFAEIMQEDQVAQGGNPNQSSILFSFYSDDSYEPIDDGPDPAKIKQRPAFIPSLDLNNLPEYESSSDEEDQQQDPNKQTEGAGDGAAHRNMTSQDYEQSMKYIENFYSKCSNGGGASQIPQQNTLDSLDGRGYGQEEDDDQYMNGHFNERDLQDNYNDRSGCQQDYVMCQINQGSSILLFDKEENNTYQSQSNINPSHLNPTGSMMMDDGDFCYSIDKQSKRRSSKDIASI